MVRLAATGPHSTPVAPRARDSLAWRIGAWFRRFAARVLVARALDLHVVGLEHVPASGPAILVARHYHHLYDAAAMLAVVPRDVHIVVALDWLGTGSKLHLLRWLTLAARWPAVWRSGRGWRFNRDGYRESLSLLREGRLLLVFPEGYPTIDPAGSRKGETDALLPFDNGFLALAERAGVHVPLIPVGLWYAARPGGGWTAWLRFAAPVQFGAPQPGERQRRVAAMEEQVRRLSLSPFVRTRTSPGCSGSGSGCG